MEKQIMKGDIVSVGGNSFVVTDARDGKVYRAKRIHVMTIEFSADDDLIERQTAIRAIMKSSLPIDLLDAQLTVGGQRVGYGHDHDLLRAQQITITYTR